MTSPPSEVPGTPPTSLAELPVVTALAPVAPLDQLKATGKLPSPKGVALEVIRLCQREDATTGELARLIQTDPALCGRLLKAANVSALGVRRPVLSVSDAVVLLGLPSVRRLALGFSLVSQHHEGDCVGFDYRGFWSQSIASALAAEALATRLRLAIPDEAFVCGLLAHVGRLAFACVYPKRYAEVIADLAPFDTETLRQRERHAFSADHLEMTAAMLSDWGFPTALVCAIDAMRDIEQLTRGETLSRTGRISLMMQTSVEMGAMICGQLDANGLQRLQVLGRVIGLDDESVDLVLAHAQVDWNAWVRLLDMQPKPPKTTTPATQPQARAARSPLPRAAAPMATAEPPLRVLIVDDSNASRTSLALLLIERGYVVESVAQSNDTFEKILGFEPDVLIADWGGPQASGLEFVRTLRQSAVGERLYVLLLTNGCEETLLKQAFEVGVDDYVEKSNARHVLPVRLQAAMRYLRNSRELSRNMDSVKRFAAELVINNRKLQAVALTDPLTGLPNRRYALERLDQELSKGRRNTTPLSCIRLDLDEFEALQTCLGETVADQLLRHLTKQVRARLRLADTFCRVGTHAFLVICADTDVVEAKDCAERLRAALENAECSIQSKSIPLTISAGVVCDPVSQASAAELFAQAERQLRVAQVAGGNRVAG